MEPDLQREPFKRSAKSICQKCSNLAVFCYDVTRSVDTDQALGIAFIVTCTRFNQPLGARSYGSNKVTADVAGDTRVETMGGGHADPEVKP